MGPVLPALGELCLPLVPQQLQLPLRRRLHRGRRHHGSAPAPSATGAGAGGGGSEMAAAAAARWRAAGEGQRGRGRSKGDPGFSTLRRAAAAPGGARLRGGKEEPGRVCRQVGGFGI